jgi:hypothetical protein
MKSIGTAVCIAVGLIVALWWAVRPPRFAPRPLPRIESQERQQCPPGSRLEGKLCVCPNGGAWTGKACTALTRAQAVTLARSG